MIKLGTKVTDRATEILGVLTHMQIQSNLSRWYIFQPCALNPETGGPVDTSWITEDRITGGEEIPDPALPLELLGTICEDDATAFRGMVTEITLHINGCVHVVLQPKGTLEKTGARIKPHDFDIRRLKGDAIKPMEESKLKRSIAEKPSPADSCSVSPMEGR